jgi:hypothetical protein
MFTNKGKAGVEEVDVPRRCQVLHVGVCSKSLESQLLLPTGLVTGHGSISLASDLQRASE